MKFKTPDISRCWKWSVIACCVFLLSAGNSLVVPVRSLASAVSETNQEENTRPLQEEEESNSHGAIFSKRAAARRTRRRGQSHPLSGSDPAGTITPLPISRFTMPSFVPGGIDCARGVAINSALRL